MPTLITGKDTFRVLQQKKALKEAFLKRVPHGQVEGFDFEERSEKEYVRAAREAKEGGLFAESKMIFLEKVSLLPESLQDTLLEVLQEKNGNVEWVIVESGTLKKTDVYTKKILAIPGIEVAIFDFPTPEETHLLLQVLNQECRVKFTAGAERLFLSRVGNNTAKLHHEHAKLVAYKEGGQITEEDIALLLEANLEDTGFQALDALSRGDRKRATLLFRELLLWKKDVLPIMGLMAWQVRQLLLLREAFDNGGRDAKTLATASGISPYTATKLLPVLSTFPLSRLKKAQRLLSQYDGDIKQGALDQSVALDILIWKI